MGTEQVSSDMFCAAGPPAPKLLSASFEETAESIEFTISTSEKQEIAKNICDSHHKQ